MKEKLTAKGEAPMGKINIYKVGSEFKGTINMTDPVKAEITIWGKTDMDCKSKVNLFLRSFFFRKPTDANPV